MLILAIETSCDDTCIAVLEIKNNKFKIISNIVSSQVKLHQKYGGVYPSLAKREHQKNLPLILKKIVQQTQNKKIDAVAVTVGPGLEPCLWTGINFAEQLAKDWKLPLIQVNHIEAHILVNFINRSRTPIKLPAVCLVVSGGHTQIILMEGIGKGDEDKSSSYPLASSWGYRILGETRDDAAGECFDKTARILGLGYPGGIAIAKQARRFNAPRDRVSGNAILPRPMINQKNYDFSFSGLKTAVLYDFKSRSVKTRKSKKYIQEMSFQIQQAIIDVLIHKTIKAARDFKVKSIILGGGVSANEELRRQFKEKFNNVILPRKEFSTDNAVMTAVAGYLNPSTGSGQEWKKIKADANLRL